MGVSPHYNRVTLEWCPRQSIWRNAMGVLEPLAIFILIMAYIWKWRFHSHPRPFWLPLVALILASHLAHRDRARAMGLQIDNFGICMRRFGTGR